MKPDGRAYFHVPALLNEVVAALQIRQDVWYIDATVGGGGHTTAILEQGGKVLALDQDKDAVRRLRERFLQEIDKGRLKVLETNFGHLKAAVAEAKIDQVKGILFDLGMSTYQIRYAGRGFSFRKDEPLDMRMSTDLSQTAADIVNKYSQDHLYEIFHKFGEEHLARQLALAIFRTRAIKPIETTGQLQRIAVEVYARAGVKEKIDPATRIFQALRITVNDELNNLRQALPQALEVLSDGGKISVISFHSLEDRIVKQFFLRQELTKKLKILTKKPVQAQFTEITENPAARSAKMRVAEKL